MLYEVKKSNCDLGYESFDDYYHANCHRYTTGVFRCAFCNSKFACNWILAIHARQSGHAAFACPIPGCEETFVDYREHDTHQRDPYVLGHALIKTNVPHECVQCQKLFKSKAELLRHAHKKPHQPYACDCGAAFSRVDVLYRHLESFDTGTPQYPCHYCRRRRGANGLNVLTI